jgi:3-carboxy-cis,cis-muconate cycloisomerase
MAAMIRVEQAWFDVLAEAGVAPAAADLTGLVGDGDVVAVAAGAEGAGNPVAPLVRLIRDRLRSRGDSRAADWLHRGLTSQDVLDTALMLCLRDVLGRLAAELGRHVEELVRLAAEHRGSLRAARTLTQHAVPTTFGLTAATWLESILDARSAVTRVRASLPVQAGGAAGTLAAATELASGAGSADAPSTARGLTTRLASRLDLTDSPPWHTRRTPVTRAAAALVTCTDAWGVIAGDVLVAARPEIGELAEPSGDGRGGSSTMPGKRNPVLSTLVRTAALRAPHLLAMTHVAAAEAVDDRPAGPWHAEWPTVQELARTALVAGSQVTELLSGLHVHIERMAATAEAAAGTLTAERGSLPGASASGTDVREYLGAVNLLIDEALTRADAALGPEREGTG